MSIYRSIYLVLSLSLPPCLTIYLVPYPCIFLSLSTSPNLYLSLSVCLSLSLSPYLSTYLSTYLSACLSTYLSACLSSYLSAVPISLSICLSVYLSIYLSTYLSIPLCLYLRLYFSLHLYLCVYLSIHASIYVLSSWKAAIMRDLQNEAILRDVLQKWKAECRADGLMQMRNVSGFSHLICLKYCACHEKIEAGSYEVLHVSRKIILANLKIGAPKCSPSQEIWPPNISDGDVFCTAPAMRNASLQILFKPPTPAIVFLQLQRNPT